MRNRKIRSSRLMSRQHLLTSDSPGTRRLFCYRVSPCNSRLLSSSLDSVGLVSGAGSRSSGLSAEGGVSLLANETSGI
jgi:hypothetical protein